MAYDCEADAANTELLEQAALHAGVLSKNPVRRYLDMVEKAQWCQLVKVPTGQGDAASLLMEVCDLARAGDQSYVATIHVTSSGLTPLADDFQDEANATALAESWLARRFPPIAPWASSNSSTTPRSGSTRGSWS